MEKNARIPSKLSKQFFVILIVTIAVMLSACLLPPIVPDETSYKYTLDANGRIIIEISQKGELVREDTLGIFDTNYAEWQQNCSNKLKATLLAGIGEDKNALRDANAETAEILKRRIAIATFILDENLASCKFKADADENIAEMEIRSILDANVLEKFKEKHEINEGVISIEIDENYIHTVRIPVDKNAGIKYIYLRAEGKIKKITPKAYALWKKHYRFRVDKFPEDANEIVVEYLPYEFEKLLEERKRKTPTPTPKETVAQKNNQNKKPASGTSQTSKTKDLNTTNIAGIKIPTDPNTLLIILLGVLGLIGLIVVIVIIAVSIRKSSTQETKKDEKRMKKVERIEKEVEKGEESTPTKRTIIPESEDIVIETRKRISEAKRIAKRFSLEEEKLIERTVEALKSKKEKYNKEQLKKVMIDMGYRSDITEEILRRLYE